MLDPEVMETIKRNFENRIGMPYDEFSELTIEEQQRIISEYRKSLQQKKTGDKVHVLVGYGEHSLFTEAKKGDMVMIRYGNIIEAGLTLQEEQQRLEDSLDDIVYSKPVAFVRKIGRRINRHFRK